MDRPTIRVRAADGRTGTAEIAPDGRFFVTLEDGRSIVVNTDDVTVLDDSKGDSG